jgi:hypothetical protein
MREKQPSSAAAASRGSRSQRRAIRTLESRLDGEPTRDDQEACAPRGRSGVATNATNE